MVRIILNTKLAILAVLNGHMDFTTAKATIENGEEFIFLTGLRAKIFECSLGKTDEPATKRLLDTRKKIEEELERIALKKSGSIEKPMRGTMVIEVEPPTAPELLN
jgi:hypothetical protein